MFNAKDAPLTESNYGTVPKGNYKCLITGVKYKKAQASSTEFFEFELSGLEGAAERRKFWFTTTFKCDNDKAVTLGHAQLADIMWIGGIAAFQKPEELNDKMNGKELIAAVIVEKDKRSGEPRNRVQTVFHTSGKHRNPKMTLNQTAPKTEFGPSSDDVPF